MRGIGLLIALMLSGCHACGAGRGATSCETCPGVCGTGVHCFCTGRHPHYCRFWDNLKTKKAARHCARANLQQAECEFDCDYRVGYEQAFVDVALGGSGEVPALPPANYWKFHARTPQGHCRAQSWFNGYAAGATQALACYEPYRRVASYALHEPAWPGACPPAAPDVWNSPYGPPPLAAADDSSLQAR